MKFKQVLAGLLVGTMVVTSAPVSGLGSLSALAASEEADDSYEKLTGLTGTADSQELTGEANGNGPIEKALDGDVDTYWHTNWKDSNAPKAEFSDGVLTGNNTYTITLEKASTVNAVTYMPRNAYDGSSGKITNGAIQECKVYVSKDGEKWVQAGEISGDNAWSYPNKGAEGADQNFVEKTITFDQAYTGITKVKIEAIKTAGPQPNQFINAAEFGVIGKEEAEDTRKAVVAPKISATAPVVDAAPADATSLDNVDNAQVFGDVSANPATLTSDNVTVEKEANGTQAFSGQIKATNDGENNGKFDVSGTTPFVINFKLKTDEVSDSTWLIGKMDDQYGVQVSPTTFDVYAHAKDNSWPTLRADLPDNFWGNWHEITAVYTGSTFRLFIDGNETATLDKTFELASYSSNLFTVGYNNGKPSGNGFLRPYAGKFADMTMYSGGDAIASDATYDAIMASLDKRTQILNIDAKAAEKSEANYTVATAWTDSKGEVVTSFAANKAYTMTATLTAKEGYKFTEESKPTTIKVGEENVTVDAVVSKDGTTLTLRHTFGEDKETPVESEARKALAAALADAEKVESADKYTEDSYKTFKEAWDAAKAVTDETSDDEVQTIATTLANAIKALKKAETPAPPVTADSVITAPRLSYTAPVAGETAVVPSYVAMEDQSAKPATLEVKDDVPTTVTEEGGVLAFQGRLTAPNNGANNDKFDVSGDTPMVLRTKVKLNTKTTEVVNILGKMDEQYGIQVDGSADRVILYCLDANNKWPEIEYKYDADKFWGEWHDIALVYTGTKLQLYVDGNAGTAVQGRPNATAGYNIVLKSSASSIFTIGYNVAKSTEHGEDSNHKKYSTLDQVDGKIADIKLYKGKDYSEGLTKSYDEIKAALEKVAPDADISAIPYTAVTTWSANGTALEKDAKFAEETVYTATTVYTARSGFKFTDISKPSVDGATVTISTDGKTMTVTKTFPKTAKIICSCVLGEITGVDNQNVDLGVADSKTVTLNAKAQVTGDCKVEGHDGTVNYTYTVTDAGTTGATVKDNAVTVTAAGTAKVKVTATLASDATKTSTKEITLTVTTGKASAEDKAKLTVAIDSVKDVKEADYTEDSYAPLKAALATANTLKEKANASKAEVDAAVKAIDDAKKGLKTKVAAKKEELNSLLTAVYDDLMKNGNTYTVASYNNAVTVYKAVKDVPGKEGVTVAELEKAINDLTAAKDALVSQETADLEKAKENASATLKNAEEIANAGQKDYEAASWKAFDAAYKALKNAPANADKATLESLTLALRNAQAALKKAETPAPEVTLDAPKVKAAKAKVTKTGVVVNVTVEAVKDAASYDVYRVVKGKATKVGTTAAGKTTVKDKKAVKGASYYAVAVSKDGKVVSKAGAAVAVKLAKAPKIQKATAGSKNAKLSWKKVKGAKVVVYRSTKKNSGYRKVATTRKNATSVTNKKGLKAGKTYYYKIATIKGKLISAMSKAKRVKIKK
ncbi:LamG-like jellyroll fold domain-containing protein [Hominisplanchenecus sp.]|uniref:LamG-like jellyroll fold domain-containing protein n=1 Tax=Hominisplanchenecus sp. TaxID=3038130 RepID=UPI0039937CDB